MRFAAVVVASLAVVAPLSSVPSVDAFTNGALLLPSYLCGPATFNATNQRVIGLDGKPKALGGVLQNLVEYTHGNTLPNNAEGELAYDPITDPAVFLSAMHTANAAAKSKLFHGPGSLNVDEAAIQDHNDMNIRVTPQVNILDVQHISAIPATVPGVGAEKPIPGSQAPINGVLANNVITPNTKVLLALAAKNNLLNPTPALLAATPNANNYQADFGGLTDHPVLDGAIVYAQDKFNNRVGKFIVPADAPVSIWPACGADGAGIVHNALLSETNVYSGPEFFLPFWYTWPVKGNPNPGSSNIAFMGAAVTDNGFGYHRTQWTVQPLPNLVIDISTLNAKDVFKCLAVGAGVSPACYASCLDCVQKGGSTKATPAAATTLTCTHDPAAGNPKLGQQTIWNAVCKINTVVTPVVPAGTFKTAPPQAKDATGAAIPFTAEQQAILDQETQLVVSVNGTQTNTQNTDNTPTQAPTTCPKSIGAASSTTLSLFSTLATVVTAMFVRQ